MSFFKDFKNDFSQAVNEILPDDESDQEEVEEQIVNTLDTEDTAVDEESENEKMKEWLEEFAQEEETKDSSMLEDEVAEVYLRAEDNLLEEELTNFEKKMIEEKEEEEEEEEMNMDDNVDLELLNALNADEEGENAVQSKEKPLPKLRATTGVVDDDVTVITKGTTITGSISSDGSLEIMGVITGDIECLGKLSITGKVTGNSSAAEIYVNTERLLGSITSEGSVKVGLGTVVIGDIVATSGVIAGAVKGEIDINGPIVIDSTAIIKGNIKAKSVQINNGAVVEGFCSLSYAAVDVDTIFE